MKNPNHQTEHYDVSVIVPFYNASSSETEEEERIDNSQDNTTGNSGD